MDKAKARVDAVRVKKDKGKVKQILNERQASTGAEAENEWPRCTKHGPSWFLAFRERNKRRGKEIRQKTLAVLRIAVRWARGSWYYK